MIKDPCNLNKKMKLLSYFDKFGLTKIKVFLYNHFIKKYDNIILPIDIDDFISLDKKESILLIGNATNKTDYNEAVDSFNGDIVRFNRFRTEKDYGLGSKVTQWVVSRNLATNKDIYGNDFSKLVSKNLKKNVDIFMASYPISDQIIDHVNIMDTKRSFEIFKKMCDLYIKSNGLIFAHDDSYFNKYKAFKPSTGILTVLNSILMYKNVKIVNFDGFRSAHYWKEDSKDDEEKYKNANMVVGHHQSVLEVSIIKTLLKNECISILGK
jgi:hypothetical protein